MLFYRTNMPKNKFIEKLKIHTIENNSDTVHDKYDFRGNINDDNFEIQAIPHSRRELFNPIIYGKVSQNNGTTELSVNMKCKKIDMFFLAIWFVICVFFSLIIYDKSLENPNLKSLIFVLPVILFILVNILFAFFAKINFRDAQEKIENILLDE